RPIVATRLLTHTQVLGDETAILTAPTADAFAGGLLTALEDRARAEAIGANARRLAETKYSYEAYLERTREACAALEGTAPPPGGGRKTRGCSSNSSGATRTRCSSRRASSTSRSACAS